jgi:hypothetical protein
MITKLWCGNLLENGNFKIQKEMDQWILGKLSVMMGGRQIWLRTIFSGGFGVRGSITIY